MTDHKLQTLQAVIFDMDGVIFDSEKLVLECRKEIAEQMGLSDITPLHKQCLGLNPKATAVKFMEYNGPEADYFTFAEQVTKRFFEKCPDHSIPTKEGVREMLSMLKEHGIRIALATSTRQEIVVRELKKAEIFEYFEAVICGDMVTKGKPDPEIFLTAAKGVGVSPENAYVAEDSYNGIRAAYAGGFHPIMVVDQIEPDEEISAMCERVYHSMTEFREELL